VIENFYIVLFLFENKKLLFMFQLLLSFFESHTYLNKTLNFSLYLISKSQRPLLSPLHFVTSNVEMISTFKAIFALAVLCNDKLY